MKQTRNNNFLLTSVVLLLLICQLWTDTVNYCFIVFDKDTIELLGSEENECEEEEYKETTEEKHLTEVSFANFYLNRKIKTTDYFKFKAKNQYSQITTPPPEQA